jgi:hypothetical protein
MHLSQGTTVDIFAVSWLKFCDGCIATAIQQFFDLRAQHLNPRIHLDFVDSDFPNFMQTIETRNLDDAARVVWKLYRAIEDLNPGIISNNLVNQKLFDYLVEAWIQSDVIGVSQLLSSFN